MLLLYFFLFLWKVTYDLDVWLVIRVKFTKLQTGFKWPFKLIGWITFSVINNIKYYHFCCIHANEICCRFTVKRNNFKLFWIVFTLVLLRKMLRIWIKVWYPYSPNSVSGMTNPRTGLVWRVRQLRKKRINSSIFIFWHRLVLWFERLK